MNTERSNRKGYDDEALKNLEEEDQGIFDDIKRIVKELLFNGARRDIVGKFEIQQAGKRDS
jgi:hypothetical protein